ncbi:MAG: tRNA (adenosine(37)-N6)-threonylcarbamoyltransferase complex ATPase subunit type 1 TsaE [Candidatus Uhrbacteria bacterium]|nr:tRNA (adenosine(37)-N6)-threonylcarbamoyltransferase complex ATPase subunit type 1 TsaE [Candidatus Uhrbacteria bacterium]
MKSDSRTIHLSLRGHKRSLSSRRPEDTNRFAGQLVKELHGGDVLALQGNLGAGKTTFTQFLAKELGIKEQITSPTFVLMKLYTLPVSTNGITRLCHIDAYRLESSDELEAIGAQEYIGSPDTLSLIEWPEKVQGSVPKNAIWISFELGGNV